MERTPISARRTRVYLAIASALSVLIFLAAFEVMLAVLARTPALARNPMTRLLARNLYFRDRYVIQYMPETARYDARLAYTLRPGHFTFSNVEFDTEFDVNSLGIRDDEVSLEAPEVILVGDSLGMGWGVEQDETFAQLLERQTGLRVLNAAVSSYGTARKLRMLERLDLSDASHLLLDYSGNDVRENLSFAQAGNRLVTMSAESYDDLVEDHRRVRQYWPGKFLRRALGQLFGELAIGWAQSVGWVSVDPAKAETRRLLDSADPASRQRNVDLFLNVLLHSPVDLSQLQIIVFELNSHNEDTDWFVPLIEETIREGDYPEHIRRIKAVPLAAELVDDDFFELDDHMKASGHAKIARRLLPLLGSAAPAVGVAAAADG